MSRFKKAARTQRKLRMTFFGPTGSGKTWTALEVATALGSNVLVIDTEYGSASLYADKFSFDTCDVKDHNLQGYVALFKEAASEGYDVVVVDSLSHAWNGAGGTLEMVDAAAPKFGSNSHFAWKGVRPLERKMLDAMLGYPGHVITTMRCHMVYESEKDERTGKHTPKKIGLAPVQKEGLESEFDIIAEMDVDHNLVITKTRYDALDGLVIRKPGAAFAAQIAAELRTGAVAVVEPPSEPGPTAAQRFATWAVVNGHADRAAALARSNYDCRVDELSDDAVKKLYNILKACKVASTEEPAALLAATNGEPSRHREPGDDDE